MARPHPLAVVVEAGSRRTFASVLDWPGWCRSDRDASRALDALVAYRDRYEPVAATAGLELPAVKDAERFEIVERLKGGATTDFGAPGAIASWEQERPGATEAERLATIAESAWTVLDSTAARTPARLRKGPRGGGRDRDTMIGHIVEAEFSYARKLGVRHQPSSDATAITAMRADVLAAIRARETAELPRGGTPWPVRYATRRIVWHVLDHVWEMEDRTD
jgi:hypothetical protein